MWTLLVKFPQSQVMDPHSTLAPLLICIESACEFVSIYILSYHKSVTQLLTTSWFRAVPLTCDQLHILSAFCLILCNKFLKCASMLCHAI